MSWRALLSAHPIPVPDGGKDGNGTVVILGGPAECPGAALLAATAALRVGAGRTQVAVHPAAVTALGVARPELLVLPWDADEPPGDDLRTRLATADVVLVGVGCDDLPAATVEELVGSTNAQVVLDAGALTAAGRIPRAIVAPNVAEAQTLCSTSDEDEATLAAGLVERLGRPVAVRGQVSVVAGQGGSWRSPPGPPCLGTPGSGDVVMGVLSALLAKGMAPEGALGWAIELHATAGAQLSRHEPFGHLAAELADRLPAALGAHLEGRATPAAVDR